MFWKFNGDGNLNLFPDPRSDEKIGKNVFQIRGKYFRISQSVDMYTRFDSDFLKEFPKSGENSVLSKCGGRSLF